jgi:hypothetical protein
LELALPLLTTRSASLGFNGQGTGLISAKGLLGLEEKCLPQSQCVLLATARENDPYAKLPKMQFAKEQVVLHA